MPSFNRLLLHSDVSCKHSTTVSWRRNVHECNNKLVCKTASGINRSWLLVNSVNENVYKLSTTLSCSVQRAACC